MGAENGRSHSTREHIEYLFRCHGRSGSEPFYLCMKSEKKEDREEEENGLRAVNTVLL